MRFAGTNCARRNTSAWVVLVLSASLLVGMPGAFAQTPPKKAAGKAPGKAGTEQKYKAIFEPVNYSEDLRLTDVHFSSADEGWVTGNAGTILHTSDGGKTWTALQGGDPKGTERAIADLRFLKGTQGWAVQRTSSGDHKLLHTEDGQNWSQTGVVPQFRNDYVFTSATTGFAAAGDKILATQDGGKKWKEAYECAVKVEINGLPRDAKCHFEKLFFPSATVGYAVSREMAPDAGNVVAKTEDGGATWTPSVALPGESGKEGGLYFTNENTGYLRTIDSKLFTTKDGGQTWTGVMAQAPGKAEIKFAGEVGWMILRNGMTYTTDGGKKWSSRQIEWPGPAAAFCLPQSDRGYVVGDHGMIYKYHIVPVEYSVKGMIGAPMMPVSKAEPSGKTSGPGAKREDERKAEEPAPGETSPAGDTKPGAGKAPSGRGGEATPAAGGPAGVGGKKSAPGKTSAGGDTVPLRSHAKAEEILQGLVNGWQEKEINVALLGGQNYMVSDCLGVHPSAGEFALKLASPNFRIEGSGIVLTFRIAHVSLNALKVRVRPNPLNVSNPCTFGGAIEMGGAASDLTYEMRLDPLLDLQRCQIGSMGQVHHTWRIGGLNLKPLQNDLDRAAKNMIEDALTYASNFNALDRVVAGINGAVGVACHK